MKLYLVEHPDPSMEFDENSMVVALTPSACYQLDKAGIQYSIIEDYYSEREMLANENEHYESLLQWVHTLDKFLRNNVRELEGLNLNLGWLYCFYFNTRVLDPLYIRCYTLRRLFENVNPSEVTFVSRQSGNVPLTFMLEDINRSYYSQIIPIYCRHENVQLNMVHVERANVHEQTKVIQMHENLLGKLMMALSKKEIVKESYYRAYFAYKYLSKWPYLQRRNQENLNLLVLRSGAKIWPELIIDALKRGHQVYGLSNSSVFEYSIFRRKNYLNLHAENSSRSDTTWQSAADLLETTDLITRINERCILDVSEIVLPRIRYFVTKICPEIVEHFKAFIEYYDDVKMDFVLAPNARMPIEIGAQAAANSNGIDTVCIVHGDDAFATEVQRFREIKNFSIHISSNKEAKGYFEQLCRKNNLPTKLYVSPHRLASVKKIRKLREKDKNKIIKNKIIYLPIPFIWEGRRLAGRYPDTWYYKFQQALLEHFSTMSGHRFVWKGLLQTDRVYNPIPDFIRESGFTNIRVAANPFVEHLHTVDKVICDFPSTGFYESVVAGVPTMSLWHRTFDVRESAIEHFGQLLKPFSDAPEAIKHIDEFLSSDPEQYKVNIDMGDKNILDILDEVAKERTNTP